MPQGSVVLAEFRAIVPALRYASAMATESSIQRAIRIACGQLPGVVFWRNNVGLASFGAHTVPYGLCPGSSDLIGIVDGRFVALEVKRPGEKPTKPQAQFLELVRRVGGFACVVTSVEDAQSAIERARDHSNSQ